MIQRILNTRIDALTSALDRERETYQMTNGEIVVFLTLSLAGALRESCSHEILTLSVSQILYHVNDGKIIEERQNLRALLLACRITED